MSKRKAPKSRYGWVSQEAWDAALASTGIVLVTVHGTGDGDTTDEGTRWWQMGSDFIERVGAEQPLSDTPITVMPFHWSGANSDFDRYQSSKTLNKIIGHFKSIKKPFYVICHSHGGNIALNAVQYHNWTRLNDVNIIAYATPILARSRNIINQSIYLILVLLTVPALFYVSSSLISVFNLINYQIYHRLDVGLIESLSTFISAISAFRAKVNIETIWSLLSEGGWVNLSKSACHSVELSDGNVSNEPCIAGSYTVFLLWKIAIGTLILALSTIFATKSIISNIFLKFLRSTNHWHGVNSPFDEVLSLLPTISNMKPPTIIANEATARRWARYGVFFGSFSAIIAFIYSTIDLYKASYDYNAIKPSGIIEICLHYCEFLLSGDILTFVFFSVFVYFSSSLLIYNIGKFGANFISQCINHFIFQNLRNAALGEDHDYNLKASRIGQFNFPSKITEISNPNIGNVSENQFNEAASVFYKDIININSSASGPDTLEVWKAVNRGIYHNAYFRDDEVIALTAKIIAENRSPAPAR